MEEKENVYHGCKAGVDQVQEINVDQTECNVNLVPEKISNPIIWDPTLAQINEAKPWTRHSLEQICSFQTEIYPWWLLTSQGNFRLH